MNLSGQVRQLALVLAADRSGAAGARGLGGSRHPGHPRRRSSSRCRTTGSAPCCRRRSSCAPTSAALGAGLLSAMQNQDGEELSRLRSTHEAGPARVDQGAEAEGGRGGRGGAGRPREEQGVGRLQARLLFDPGTRQQSESRRAWTRTRSSRDWQRDSGSGRAAGQRQQHHAKRLDPAPDVGLGVVRRLESRRRRSGDRQRLQGDGERDSYEADPRRRPWPATTAERRTGSSRPTWQRRKVEQLDKQILAAEIRKQIAATDLANHEQQIAQRRRGRRAPDAEVHQPAALQLDAVAGCRRVHFQAYQLAYQTAKQAEKAYQHELGPENAGDTFVSRDQLGQPEEGTGCRRAAAARPATHGEGLSRRQPAGAGDHQADLAVPARPGTAAASPPDRLLRHPYSRGRCTISTSPVTTSAASRPFASRFPA